MKRIFLLFIVLSISACGGPRHTLNVNMVEGTVTLDGQPMAEVFVQFIPKTPGSGEVAGGYSDQTGKYRLTSTNGSAGQGAMTGEYTVTVSKVEITETYPPGADTNEVSPTVTKKELFPDVYTDQTKSPITKSVSAGKNVIDIEVSSKP